MSLINHQSGRAAPWRFRFHLRRTREGKRRRAASKADGERSAPVLLSIRILMATSNNNDIK